MFWYSYLTKDGKSVFEQIRREDFLVIADAQLNRNRRGVVNLTERDECISIVESVRATPNTRG